MVRLRQDDKIRYILNVVVVIIGTASDHQSVLKFLRPIIKEFIVIGYVSFLGSNLILSKVTNVFGIRTAEFVLSLSTIVGRRNLKIDIVEIMLLMTCIVTQG
ncbi:hypothetical protein LOTGIDRAFT_159063 [Lottia gigantea]|uniref:Uncharacterized protein n=1 Tax=Lottia gigantea TaxID=225164 RepID=V4AM92_LOTGI|nr:hypothetical protein LOTGIDRAFT_159063 [Lottia gigantea]ESO98267.1 hypothetical protein LOTGIDRAFT_159063 [Lottia gigantea]